MSFGLYLRTLSPCIHPDDSPETVTAGLTLSIQHPPGYPLHSLLGRLATVLGPGAPAFDVNLLSALCAALAVVLLAFCARALILEVFPEAERAADGLAGVLALAAGASKEVWFQATIAKGGIYALNLALGLGVLLSVLRARKTGDPMGRPYMLLGGMLFGLGMANHWTSVVVLVPGLLILYGEPVWRREGMEGLKAAWKPLVWPALASLAGLSLYLYLPLRSKLGPVMQWGEPWTWEGFWWVFNRSQYAVAEAGKTLAQFQWLLGRIGEVLLTSYHPLGLGLLALGWGLWFKRAPWLAGGVLAMPLTLALAVAWKANPPSDSVWIIDPYLVPVHASVALGAVGWLGLPALARWAAPLALLLALSNGARHWKANDHAQDYLGYDYVNNLFLSCPKDAVVFCEGDSNTAGPIFGRFVLNKRRDLALVAAVLSDYPWYIKSLQAYYPDLKLPPSPLGPATNMGWIAQLNPARPAVHTNSYTKAWVDTATLLPRGLVLLRQSGEGMRAPWSPATLARWDPWKAYVTRGSLPPYARSQDPLSVRLVTDNYREAKARYGEGLMAAKDFAAAESEFVALGLLKKGWAAPWVQAGNAAFQRGALPAAGGHWQRAVDQDGTSAEALANFGLYHFYMKDYDRAMALARQALERDPNLPNAKTLLEESRQRAAGQVPVPAPAPAQAQNSGTALAAEADKAASEGRADDAIRLYEQAIKAGFESAGVHRNIAVMHAKQNRLRLAAESMRKAIAMEPKVAEQHRYLGIFLFNQGDREGGIKALQKALQIDPKDAQARQLLEQAGAAMKKAAP